MGQEKEWRPLTKEEVLREDVRNLHEWWHSSPEEIYFELALRLVDKGLSRQDAMDVLSRALFAAADEYGD